ncbi:ribosomal protein S12 methylthiotransferase RimO [Candidatus Kuenenia stuttgartiensis]|nr:MULTISPECIES: 30S ribosomal protein S12 methylthiotransferase RimO [Kuenenia]MBW7942255.1 30S ribosomal protein S12 methylthiotransferase RimO [Candidatus Kuenenia stuttgartiensis]MBZ0190913.1 30S ribosomal protein S12 methylthiotransferase RimO [Candidatus Kuenenia stuttgartiensis]MCL4726839.1 30S ribosomal protein S12 methylthiotransferase RimO [Candidatus Kuenenia stuttgartiensis]MCZ7621322.1 30S ribosomal protein S12 methylthiotransferase RimO [Candidatus Kuenenia sp.]QII12583.1 ribosom
MISKSKTVALINLGCTKNLVDAEEMLGRIAANGSTICQYPEDAEVLVVNTCGFIDDSKKESIDMIFKMAKLKENAQCKKLIVTGCLAQRYSAELKSEIPEIDDVVGLKDFEKITHLTGKRQMDNSTIYQGDDWRNRIRLTPKHYSYLRISDGCDNRCTYCAIPGIRGNFMSRSIENILEESRQMASEGVKEINIISQDTTSYGLDIYGKQMLHVLLEKIAAIEGIQWIRLLYTHPGHFYPELINTINEHETICKYIDLPIQHINDTILGKMGRNTTRKSIETLINNLRRSIRSIVLRTSVIVGFPGETDEQYQELLEFIKKTKFERLGVFAYSKEENTPAAKFKKQVGKKVKQERLNEIMLAQREIVWENNKNLIGKKASVIVDEKEVVSGMLIGRTSGDAPEVDGKVFINDKQIKVGEIRELVISNVNGYDLVA